MAPLRTTIVMKPWDANYGDRRQQIVFIGLNADMDKEAITERLNNCLIEDYLSGQDLHMAQNDPFPAWFQNSQ